MECVAAPSPNFDVRPTGTPLDMRRVLVVISDGEDTLSRRSRSEAIDMAQRAGIVIYTISTSTEP